MRVVERAVPDQRDVGRALRQPGPVRAVVPDQFQRAEFLLEHGMIDMIVERKQLKGTLSTLVNHF